MTGVNEIFSKREKKNFTGKAERGEKGRKSRQKIGGLNRIFLREKNFTGKAECGKKGRKSQQKIGGVNRIFLRERKLYWKGRAGEHINLLRPKSVVPGGESQ